MSDIKIIGKIGQFTTTKTKNTPNESESYCLWTETKGNWQQKSYYETLANNVLNSKIKVNKIFLTISQPSLYKKTFCSENNGISLDKTCNLFTLFEKLDEANWSGEIWAKLYIDPDTVWSWDNSFDPQKKNYIENKSLNISDLEFYKNADQSKGTNASIPGKQKQNQDVLNETLYYWVNKDKASGVGLDLISNDGQGSYAGDEKKWNEKSPNGSLFLGHKWTHYFNSMLKKNNINILFKGIIFEKEGSPYPGDTRTTLASFKYSYDLYNSTIKENLPILLFGFTGAPSNDFIYEVWHNTTGNGKYVYQDSNHINDNYEIADYNQEKKIGRPLASIAPLQLYNLYVNDTVQNILYIDAIGGTAIDHQPIQPKNFRPGPYIKNPQNLYDICKTIYVESWKTQDPSKALWNGDENWKGFKFNINNTFNLLNGEYNSSAESGWKYKNNYGYKFRLYNGIIHMFSVECGMASNLGPVNIKTQGLPSKFICASQGRCDPAKPDQKNYCGSSVLNALGTWTNKNASNSGRDKNKSGFDYFNLFISNYFLKTYYPEYTNNNSLFPKIAINTYNFIPDEWFNGVN